MGIQYFGGCRHSWYPPRLKYWKNLIFLFSFLVRIVLFLYFIGGIYCQKYHYMILLASFEKLHPYNVSIQETKIIAQRSSRS